MSDELSVEEYYCELQKFKHHYSKEFKRFIVNQLRPLNIKNTVLIDCLIKKDKKESRATLKLRKTSKVFGACTSNEEHLIKLRPLFDRIQQCNGDHEIFRRSGSKARQVRLIQKLESNQLIKWSEVDPADAASLLKTYVGDLRRPLVSVEWEKSFQLLAECTKVDSKLKLAIIQALFLCLSKSNGNLLSKIITLLYDTKQKSSAPSCTESLALILWPNIQRNLSLEIGTNRVRRECSIEAIKFMIENWYDIIKPNQELSKLMQNQLQTGKPSSSFRFKLPRVFRQRIDKTRRHTTSVTQKRQKLLVTSRTTMKNGDSIGCLTDCTDDDANEIRTTNKKSARTLSFTFGRVNVQPNNSLETKLNSKPNIETNLSPQEKMKIIMEFDRAQRRNTFDDYYPSLKRRPRHTGSHSFYL